MCVCVVKVLEMRLNVLFSFRSGIEEPPRSDFQVTADEALLLKKEAEEAATTSTKRKREMEEGDAMVLAAAETTLAAAKDGPSTSSGMGVRRTTLEFMNSVARNSRKITEQSNCDSGSLPLYKNLNVGTL